MENIEEMNWISSLGSSLRLPNRFRKEIKYCKPIQVHNNVYVIFDILRNNFLKNFLFKINYLPYKQKKLSKIVSLPPYSSFPFLSYPPSPLLYPSIYISTFHYSIHSRTFWNKGIELMSNTLIFLSLYLCNLKLDTLDISNYDFVDR